MSLQENLRLALTDYLSSGKKGALQSLVDEHPEIISPSLGDYPDTHRIVDVRIGDAHYRVCRQISTGEKLTLSLVDEAFDDPGVPIWLKGEKLKKWAVAEEDDPSDEPTDWEAYR
jgi:hypothetical protein